MPDRVVISNTSPIYYLHQIGCLDLFCDLYGKLVIPPAVEAELAAGAAKGLDIPDLSTFPWLEIQELEDRSVIPVVVDLGAGESEVIALGLRNPGSLLILDDRLGRQIAGLNNLTFTGTLGLLLKAKAKGLVAELTPLIEQLRSAGMYIAERVVMEVQRQAGEG